MKKKKHSEKSLAQIAYERGGIQNFGPWEKLDCPVGKLVKDIHRNMVDAVIKELKRRLDAQFKITDRKFLK